jgi:hypothetical protein
MGQIGTTSTGDSAVLDHSGFDDVTGRMQLAFQFRTENGVEKLFTTDAPGLWETYLWNLPGAVQYHTCNCCRRFIERFGGLVHITEDGKTVSALWHLATGDQFYQPAVDALCAKVEKAKVNGVFYSDEKVWGTPKGPGMSPDNGLWTHFAIAPPAHLVSKSKVHTAYALAAEKGQDYIGMITALKDFSKASVATAITLLETDTLYRSEKCLGVANWLHTLMDARDSVKDSRVKSNLLWRAVAYAPPGFAHPRSSMIGTLLEDLQAGLAFTDVSKRFKAKMHPLQYQRPTAAPTSGAIAAAEKLFETMGYAPSLERRFALLNEIQTIWRPKFPKAPAAGAGGVFGHLETKDGAPSVAALKIPVKTVTWAKFRDTVLPGAEQITALVPTMNANFAAYVTAQYDDAPPILQWDREERRNPFSHYLYHGGSAASQWNLIPGSWVKVNALSEQPAHWYGAGAFGVAPSNQSEGVLFVLNACRDIRHDRAGNALFPETLKAEVHGVRAVIEAYSKKAHLHGEEEASACGLIFQKQAGAFTPNRFRVVSKGVTMEYSIDRWD